MDQQKSELLPFDINEIKGILDPMIQVIRANKRGSYLRSGFQAHSYFSFGDYINPEILPEAPLVAIVEYVISVSLKNCSENARTRIAGPKFASEYGYHLNCIRRTITIR